MLFNTGYYHSLDREFVDSEDSPMPVLVDAPQPVGRPETQLGPQEIGTTTNPMENTLNSLQAKIREGAGKIEFSFLGSGKGSSQRPGPESFGKEEREQMRELTRMNEMRTSVHAAVHSESLAGMGREGFSREEQAKVSKEIERAINFAAEATQGGAIVFHVQEWQRPISEIKEKESGKQLFASYEEEDKEAPVLFADQRTGRFVGSVSKDQEVIVPKFKTNENGDWIDINGKVIEKGADAQRLFDRVPEWNPDGTNFQTEVKKWKDFVKEAEDWNKHHDKKDHKSPGEMFIMNQYNNRILQSKGSSLFYARDYENQEKVKAKLEKQLQYWKEIEETTPEDEKWKLKKAFMDRGGELLPPDVEMPSEHLQKQLKMTVDTMRHIHEASASADAQAAEYQEVLNNVKPVADVGMNRTAQTIARAGISAMHYTDRHKKDLKDPIFVAPENWAPQAYGSHPDELRDVIDASRKEMMNRLVKQEGYSKERAEKAASTHIKATLDTGHLNMWRSMFKKEDGESHEDREKRFRKWYVGKVKTLAEKGYIGHVHLADNMGYDDEHLTPGQGNAPIKDVVKDLEKAGITDFIVEPGSFNPFTAMHDTWAMLGSPTYSLGVRTGGGGGNFGGLGHGGRFGGYMAPPMYIVGSYSPSNEWKLWSEVPLE